ncbi:MAG: glycosyltransferase family 9 protein [Calditrichaeota bacterium]|nr:MAG: glycosyltransferase family 9 protein [Calditrichota bacterium]
MIPEKVLIVRTDRLGDVILSTPVTTAFKQTFPGVKISMLANSRWMPLLQTHEDIDELISDNQENSTKLKPVVQLAGEIRSRAFDVAVVLHPTFRLALVLYIASVPVRLGSGYRWYSFLFNRRHFEHRKFSQKHELEYNLSLVETLGVRLDQIRFRFHLPEKLNRLTESFIQKQKPVIVIHPGSGKSARNWRPQCYGHLAKICMERLGATVLITGTRDEHGLVKIVQNICGHRAISLCGRLTILQLAALLQQADLLITNSTGPLHLATALGTPVIGLYAPLPACHPQRWGPYGQGENVIMARQACHRCIKSKSIYCSCMDEITVQHVFEKVCHILNSKKISIQTSLDSGI